MKLIKIILLAVSFMCSATFGFCEDNSLVIDESGNVGINSVPDPNYQLNVKGDTNISGKIVVNNYTILPVPIGSIIAWHKNGASNLTLPTGWVECNGQKLIDETSPFNNINVPNLNSQKYSNGRGNYLRGSNTSGKFNESTYWTDNGVRYKGFSGTRYYGVTFAKLSGLDSSGGSATTYSGNRLGSSRRFQVAAMTVVWIMRIK